MSRVWSVDADASPRRGALGLGAILSAAGVGLSAFPPFARKSISVVLQCAAVTSWAYERQDMASFGLSDVRAEDLARELCDGAYVDAYYNLAARDPSSVVSAPAMVLDVVTDDGSVLSAAFGVDTYKWCVDHYSFLAHYLNIYAADFSKQCAERVAGATNNDSFDDITAFQFPPLYQLPQILRPEYHGSSSPVAGLRVRLDRECSSPLLAKLRKLVLARAARASKLLHALTAYFLLAAIATTDKQLARLVPALFPDVDGSQARISGMIAPEDERIVHGLLRIMLSAVATAGVIGGQAFPDKRDLPAAFTVSLLSPPTVVGVPGLEAASKARIRSCDLDTALSRWMAKGKERLHAYI